MSHAPGDLLPSPRILMGAGPTMADPRVLGAMATPLLLGQFDPEFHRGHERSDGTRRRVRRSVESRRFKSGRGPQ